MSASPTASPSSSFGDVDLRPVVQTPRFVQYEGTGTKVFTIEKPAAGTQRVEVAVVGRWSLAVHLLEDAPPLLSHNSGTGDGVFLYLDAPQQAAISWSGAGALITVAGLSKEKGTEVLVNDNKPGHRTFQLHTGEFVQVSGVAHWTINVLGSPQ